MEAYDRIRKEIKGSIEEIPLSGPVHIVCGIDISFFPSSPDQGVVGIVYLSYPSLTILHESYTPTTLNIPYISGYLAFREFEPVKLALADTIEKQGPPDVIIVDGNGRMHPDKCGLACHVGVHFKIPTIGVGKTYLKVNGIPRIPFLAQFKGRKQSIVVEGDEVGVAWRPFDYIQKPIYISVGSHITLENAMDIISHCCIHRIPEPIRMADQGSRKYIRNQGL